MRSCLCFVLTALCSAEEKPTRDKHMALFVLPSWENAAKKHMFQMRPPLRCHSNYISHVDRTDYRIVLNLLNATFSRCGSSRGSRGRSRS